MPKPENMPQGMNRFCYSAIVEPVFIRDQAVVCLAQPYKGNNGKPQNQVCLSEHIIVSLGAKQVVLRYCQDPLARCILFLHIIEDQGGAILFSGGIERLPWDVLRWKKFEFYGDFLVHAFTDSIQDIHLDNTKRDDADLIERFPVNSLHSMKLPIKNLIAGNTDLRNYYHEMKTISQASLNFIIPRLILLIKEKMGLPDTILTTDFSLKPCNTLSLIRVNSWNSWFLLFLF